MSDPRPWGLVLLIVGSLAVAACKKEQGSSEASPAAAEPAAQPAAEPAAQPAAEPAAQPAAAADGCKELRDNQGIPACEAACSAGSAKACGIAGFLHQEEDDDETADTNALPFFQKGCEGGDAAACREVGVFYRGGLGGLPQDEAKKNEFLARAAAADEKACEAGEATPCWRAGAQYDTAEGVTADKAKALVLWKRACELGHTGACDNVKKAEAGGQ